jgi:hypothetical protein
MSLGLQILGVNVVETSARVMSKDLILLLRYELGFFDLLNFSFSLLSELVGKWNEEVTLPDVELCGSWVEGSEVAAVVSGQLGVLL